MVTPMLPSPDRLSPSGTQHPESGKVNRSVTVDSTSMTPASSHHPLPLAPCTCVTEANGAGAPPGDVEPEKVKDSPRPGFQRGFTKNPQKRPPGKSVAFPSLAACKRLPVPGKHRTLSPMAPAAPAGCPLL